MYKIIDTHTHTYPDAIAGKAAENLGKFYNFKVSESGTFRDLEECERKAGISGFLLLPVATSAEMSIRSTKRRRTGKRGKKRRI